MNPKSKREGGASKTQPNSKKTKKNLNSKGKTTKNRVRRGKKPGNSPSFLSRQVDKLKEVDIQDLGSCPEIKKFVEFVVAHMVAQSVWVVLWGKSP
jgi:hypothetical protein